MKGRWAIAHRVRFRIRTNGASLDILAPPPGSCSWKFGPELAGRKGQRAESDVWCGIALFGEWADAERAFEAAEAYVPNLADAIESWRGLLLPIVHKGECNHLDGDRPGLLFDVADTDPGGPLLVMTTAGFQLRNKNDLLRLIDFRRRVEAMRPVIEAAEGSLAHQVFAPTNNLDDGVTLSIWGDDQSMLSFAYRPGPHRVEVDRQRDLETVDRSSFTRFRIVRSSGQWRGVDPLTCQPC